MPVGNPVRLTKGTTSTSGTSVNTSSFAPTAGRLLVVFAYAREASSSTPGPNVSIAFSSGSWSMTEVTVSNDTGNRHTLSAFYGTVPDGAGTQIITISADETSNRWGWAVYEIADVSATIAYSITGLSTSSSCSVALGYPDTSWELNDGGGFIETNGGSDIWELAPAAWELASGSGQWDNNGGASGYWETVPDLLSMACIASIADTDGVTSGTGFTEEWDSAPANSTTMQVQYGNAPQTSIGWSGAATTGNLMIGLMLVPNVVTAKSITVRYSVNDTWYEASCILETAQRIALVEVAFDQAANEIRLIVDGRVSTMSATTATSGTLNPQTGSRIVGAPIVNGVVQSDSSEAAIGYVAVYDQILTSNDYDNAVAQAARWLAPIVSNGSGLGFPKTGSATFSMSPFVKNPGGTDTWRITSVSLVTGSCEAVIQSDQQRILVQNITSLIGDVITLEVTVENTYSNSWVRNSATFRVSGLVIGDQYTNGYAIRHRVQLFNTSPLAWTNFPLLFDNNSFTESKTMFKTVANGGEVQHASGYDIVFELEDGTTLDHEIEYWDGTTGRLIAWIRIPTFAGSNSNPRTRLWAYAGNTSISAATANATGVWQDYLAVWNCRTGADRSGNSRTLTPTSVSAGTLIGDAGDFNGTTSKLAISSLSGLAGLTSLTIQALVASDSTNTNRTIVRQGPDSSAADTQALALYWRKQSASGAANPMLMNVKTTLGSAYSIVGPNLQTTANRMIHGTWRSGQAPIIRVDGVEETVVANAAIAGEIATVTGDFQIGVDMNAAAAPADGNWNGLIDEMRLRALDLPLGWCQLEAKNYLTPNLVCGMGSRDASTDTNASPTGAAFDVTGIQGQPTTIDVASLCYDPDAATELTVTSAGSPSTGAAVITNNQVVFTPSQAGTETWFATVSDGTKTCLVCIRCVSVLTPVVLTPTDIISLAGLTITTSASAVVGTVLGKIKINQGQGTGVWGISASSYFELSDNNGVDTDLQTKAALVAGTYSLTITYVGESVSLSKTISVVVGGALAEPTAITASISNPITLYTGTDVDEEVLRLTLNGGNGTGSPGWVYTGYSNLQLTTIAGATPASGTSVSVRVKTKIPTTDDGSQKTPTITYQSAAMASPVSITLTINIIDPPVAGPEIPSVSGRTINGASGISSDTQLSSYTAGTFAGYTGNEPGDKVVLQ